MQDKNPKKKNTLTIVPNERIISRIFLIRGKKVMFDRDLAELYGVEIRALNQAVKRNIKRFPVDFMFQLTKEETEIWKAQILAIDTDSSRSQIVILKKGQNIKYQPYVFTEQGVAMLSSVLNSERAILVNIQIIRAFTKLRELLLTHTELRRKIDKLEKKVDGKLTKHDQQFKAVFEVIRRLLDADTKPIAEIGFKG